MSDRLSLMVSTSPWEIACAATRGTEAPAALLAELAHAIFNVTMFEDGELEEALRQEAAKSEPRRRAMMLLSVMLGDAALSQEPAADAAESAAKAPTSHTLGDPKAAASYRLRHQTREAAIRDVEEKLKEAAASFDQGAFWRDVLAELSSLNPERETWFEQRKRLRKATAGPTKSSV